MVVSGIPGSGKTRLARSLAPRLGLPMLDKDYIESSLTSAALPARSRQLLSAAAIDYLPPALRRTTMLLLKNR